MRSTLIQVLRGIRRNWKVSAAVIISIGLALGLNLTVFSILNAVMLRSVPGVSQSARLVELHTSYQGGMSFGAVAYPDYEDWRRRNQAFTGVLAQSVMPMSLNGTGENQVIPGALVSENYFDVLGVRPLRGRTFTSGEEPRAGATPVAVLSHPAWQRLFGGDPGVVGRTVTINTHAFTVVGVMPEGFAGANLGLPADVWVPLNTYPVFLSGSGAANVLDDRGNHWLQVIGRLRPGVSLEQAQSAMTAMARQMAADYPDTNARTSVTVVGLGQGPEALQSNLAPVLVILMALVGLVLVAACFNVANLLLASASAREGEFALRAALGARWGRIATLVVSESVLLTFFGGILALLLAIWSTSVVSAFRPPMSVTLALDVRPDWWVLGLGWLLTVLVGIAVGIVPAYRMSRKSPMETMQRTLSLRGSARTILRDGLVIAQVTVSVVLLVGAGLMVRSLVRAQQADPGFRSGGLLLASVDAGLAGYDPARADRSYGALLDRLNGLPGVRSASLAQAVPMEVATSQQRGVFVEDTRVAQEHDVAMDFNVVSPGYFRTMEIPLRGRDFTLDDNQDAPGVVIVNQAFVRRYWPDGSALGKRIRLAGGDRRVLEVVGVTRDSKYYSLQENPLPFIYLPLRQHLATAMTLHVRGTGDPVALVTGVRAAVAGVDRGIPVFRVRTMEEHLGTSLIALRLAAVLLGVFAVTTLVLAATGVYAVVAFSVEQRTREVGIRLAFGARPADLMKLAFRQWLRLAGIGIVAGLGLAIPVMTLLASLLFGVSPADPATLTQVALVLAVTTLAATFLPARRFLRVAPAEVLR